MFSHQRWTLVGLTHNSCIHCCLHQLIQLLKTYGLFDKVINFLLVVLVSCLCCPRVYLFVGQVSGGDICHSLILAVVATDSSCEAFQQAKRLFG